VPDFPSGVFHQSNSSIYNSATKRAVGTSESPPLSNLGSTRESGIRKNIGFTTFDPQKIVSCDEARVLVDEERMPCDIPGIFEHVHSVKVLCPAEACKSKSIQSSLFSILGVNINLLAAKGYGAPNVSYLSDMLSS
jgi:hypothetical protein